jgi:hypothetical protein
MTDRKVIARIGGLALHLKYDSREVTAPARAASARSLDARLLAVVDPDGTLTEATRQKRLGEARSRHFKALRARQELKRAQS